MDVVGYTEGALEGDIDTEGALEGHNDGATDVDGAGEIVPGTPGPIIYRYPPDSTAVRGPVDTATSTVSVVVPAGSVHSIFDALEETMVHIFPPTDTAGGP